MLLLFFHLKARGKPVWVVVIPLLFLIVMTTIAGVMGVVDQVGKGNWIVVAFGSLFLLLEALVFGEAWKRWRADRRRPSQLV